jgi:hypothetical protein
MDGRAFLDVARDLAGGGTEAHWRSAIGRAYYALMLEGREALSRWGRTLPRGQNVHTWSRLRFTYAADVDLKEVGLALDDLVQLRNQADYNLAPSPVFASAARALQAIQRATDALARLDAIEADPARRAAAIAALPP